MEVGDILNYDPLADMSKKLGCDYIKLLPDHHRIEPDVVGERRGWTIFGENFRDVKLFSPVFEWSFKGKRYAAKLTPVLKKGGYGNWICGAEYDEFDAEEMNKELIKLIKETKDDQ